MASASTPATEPELTIEVLVRLALAYNPQLPIARETQEAARQRLSALRAFPNPALETTPGLVGRTEARDEYVIIGQPLDIFGKRRAQAAVAAAELRRTQAETTLAERTLTINVKNAAVDLFAAQEAESLSGVQVEVAQLFREAARRRAALGDVPPIQVQRADLELLRTQNELTNAQAERLSRRTALNQLIGQAPETPLRVALPGVTGLTDLLHMQPGPLGQSGGRGAIPPTLGAGGTAAGATPPFFATGPVSAPGSTGANVGVPASGQVLGQSAPVGGALVGLRSQLLPNALTNRPDVVSAQATLATRQAQVEVLRRERLPNFELQARRSAFFGRPGSYALRAVITLPIFDFGSLKGERRAAAAEVRAQAATLTLLRSQVATQVEQALLRLDQQRHTVELYRNGIIPNAVDLLRKTQVGYGAGASTYLEVLEAQRTLRQVQAEYLQALVGTRANETALESALGAAPPAVFLGAVTDPEAGAARVTPSQSNGPPSLPSPPPATPQGGR